MMMTVYGTSAIKLFRHENDEETVKLNKKKSIYTVIMLKLL